MTTTIDPDIINLARRSNIELGQIAQAKTKAEIAAITVTAQLDADEAHAALQKLDQQLADARRRKTTASQERESARRERGEAMVAGESTAAIDKRIVTIDREIERLDDELAALETRRSTAERDFLMTTWHARRELMDAYDNSKSKAIADVAEAEAQLKLAGLVRDLIVRQSDAAHEAHHRAYQAILTHKTANPSLYPKD